MARKKDKIRVNLELPKDDKTQSNFIAILMVGMFLGISCLGFWITNADLVFKPANGNPMFLNLACPDSLIRWILLDQPITTIKPVSDQRVSERRSLGRVLATCQPTGVGQIFPSTGHEQFTTHPGWAITGPSVATDDCDRFSRCVSELRIPSEDLPLCNRLTAAK